MTRTAFISSTSLDLAEYRKAAIDACNELGIVPTAMEFFGATGVGATAGSTQKLSLTDVYVGIFAHRYGYIEEGHDKSVTELEFDHAGECGLERLCFVVDPKFPWPPDAWEYQHHEALERFKARIDKLIRARFTTVADFKAQLLRALVQWRDRTGQRPEDATEVTRSRRSPPASSMPVPSLLVGRERDIEDFKQRLGVDDRNCRRPLTVVRGWPGVGKTAFIAAIANNPSVVAAFPDGILWASVGEMPDPMKELKAWADALGSSLQSETSLTEVISRLRILLRQRTMLLIVDDIWETDAALPFRVAGENCATIFTTRFGDVARELTVNQEDVYVLERLTDDDGVKLLQQLAPYVSSRYPQESRELVADLEGLPLALRVAGRLLEHEASTGFDVRDSFQSLSSEATLLRQRAPEDRFDPATGTTPTVQLLLRKSTDRLNEESRRSFACLGEFAPKPATFDLEAIRAVTDLVNVKPIVLELVDRGLLEPIPSIGRFWMHAVLVLHAKSLLEAL